MILTPKQELAVKIAVQRYRDGEKYTIISGYAGSGKSTSVRAIIDALQVPLEKVAYCAYTGKAAEVLRKKGNPNACTMHHLLYKFRPLPNGGFMKEPKDVLDYNIIVIDEISMAPKEMVDLLLTHDVYMIGLGDPGQLPPIDKEQDNHLLDHPHIFLDQIMRQAAESEIIQLTMKIRNNEPITTFHGKDVQILSKEELNTGMMTWADQILVATNAKRNAINAQMRELLGHHSKDPEEGDKVICARNYWEVSDDSGNALVNGTIGYLHNPYISFERIPKYIKTNHPDKIEVISSDFVSESNTKFNNILMDKKLMLTGEESLDWKTKYILSRRKITASLVPREFLYGYSITVHKAQGSEWDNILVLEENFPKIKEEHTRWLYTACTRASNKLVLILK